MEKIKIRKPAVSGQFYPSTAPALKKQIETLINLSTTAIRREISKEELNLEAIEKKVKFIETATKDIISVLEKLTSIKKPVLTDYLNNLKMIDINTSMKKNL